MSASSHALVTCLVKGMPGVETTRPRLEVRWLIGGGSFFDAHMYYSIFIHTPYTKSMCAEMMTNLRTFLGGILLVSKGNGREMDGFSFLEAKHIWESESVIISAETKKKKKSCECKQ